MTTNKTELDVNYENLVENLLLQQVLLYTQENSSAPATPKVTTSNSLLVRQADRPSSSPTMDTSTEDDPDSKATLCLIESSEDQSSHLIENILRAYNQRHSHIEHNLIELIIERNRARRCRSTCPNDVFHLRLQWLAIGLVVDRLFFYLYFIATLVSYLVTLWVIPLSHPDLIIDINTL